MLLRVWLPPLLQTQAHSSTHTNTHKFILQRTQTHKSSAHTNTHKFILQRTQSYASSFFSAHKHTQVHSAAHTNTQVHSAAHTSTRKFIFQRTQTHTHFWDTTVGGSCCGSPAITTHWAPRVRGTSTAGSVAYTCIFRACPRKQGVSEWSGDILIVDMSYASNVTLKGKGVVHTCLMWVRLRALQPQVLSSKYNHMTLMSHVISSACVRACVRACLRHMCYQVCDV